MGSPTLHVFSLPSFDEEHGGYTRVEPGPWLPLRGTVRKLAEEIKQEYPEWTPEQLKAEVRRRLRKEKT
jgi:hypothetical protein